MQLAAAQVECRQRQAPITIALIDIDHFKQINDRHGHATGDQVLRRIAATIGELAQPDRIAGRYGGEEFAVIFPGSDVAKSVAWCESLCRTIEHLNFDDVTPGLRVTVSIGVSEVGTSSNESPYELADQRLYLAKRAGRNQVVASSGTTIQT
jgi:diguanylate cyclase (GGDEF)-like protein